MTSDFPRRAFPCNECPVRKDNANNPMSKFPEHRWRALRETIVGPGGGSAPFGSTLFGCHKGEPGTNEDLACAGWLASFGGRSVNVRLAVVTGALPIKALSPGDGWPELYEDWDEMAEGQLWRPGDPDDHLPQGLSCKIEREESS